MYRHLFQGIPTGLIDRAENPNLYRFTSKMTQSPNEVIMVRPVAFGYDPETAKSNAFQHQPDNETQKDCSMLALSEFDEAVSKLQSYGVKVTVFNEDPSSVRKPDAIFPNNWFSTHSNGMIILYPMMAKSRRQEKRQDIVEYLKDNYKVPFL